MHHEPRSNWAFIIIVSIIILFGLFWYIETSKIKTAPPAISQQPVRQEPNPAASLEASAEAIVIPDYSDTEY